MKIETLDELKSLLQESEEPVDCYIALNGGLRSGKSIQYWEDGMELDDEDANNLAPGETILAEWLIDHDIDDTSEAFESDEEMLSETNIGEAIEQGSLFLY